jgi:hypothetical protein
MKKATILGLLAAVAVVIAFASCSKAAPKPGEVKDEALLAGRTAQSLPGAGEDYFHAMDRGVELTSNEVIGRNNWIAWTAGNDRFWDHLANSSFGAIDLLKTLSSHDELRYCGNPAYPDYTYPASYCDDGPGTWFQASRANRWKYFGLVNEPCFSQATGPRRDRYGLWLDTRDEDCPPDPFENEKKYPGVAIGARGKNIPLGSYYGYASGIVGLRLFPNPDFDEAAEARWDPEAYYTKPEYYNDKDLVRPYRVGMSCGFCHVGPSPVNPPADPENPEWENLTSNPGAQYFWIDRIFFWHPDTTNFAWQLFHTSPPGALDTSFVSSDNINNPRTMNAVYSIAARLAPAKRYGEEKLAGGSLDNAQFNDYSQTAFLSEYFIPPDTVLTPHVLKDGADAVGILGALNRVYLNIGLFSEEWLLHFNQLVGGKPITPIPIATARANSTYWNANELQTPDLALFFAKTAPPDSLRGAPGGDAYLLREDDPRLTQGKQVFARTCARCHSGKLPELPEDKTPDHWDAYWEYTKTDEFKEAMTEVVMASDFLDSNFLSTEVRIPVTLLGTNACSPLATNAIAGDIWDNFSSQTYKELPSVGTYRMQNPFTGEWFDYEMPGGGRGYTRPASLISLWSTAPYLLNNSVGEFSYLPSVESRMASFDDSIGKMLWPEKRKTDAQHVRELGLPQSIAVDNLEGWMYRTTDRSYLKVALKYLPKPLDSLLGFARFLPWIDDTDMMLEIGPIPAGTPVGLLSNLNPLSEDRSLAARAEYAKKLLGFLKRAIHDLKYLPQDASDEQSRAAFANLVPDLLSLSKCPDYVVNRGHYFGTDRFDQEPGLSDDDKQALIEYLKTL